MARYNPDNTMVSVIYSATEHWRDNCLKIDGSVFDDEKQLWTTELLCEVTTFVKKVKPTGMKDDAFFDALNIQLKDAPPECKQLVAEELWLIMLYNLHWGAAGVQANAGGIRQETKRRNVRKVWGWSGEELQENHRFLTDDVLGGVGSSRRHSINRAHELIFLTEAVRKFKSMPDRDQASIIGNAWVFVHWLSNLPESKGCMLRSILPHLLFPDHFERVSALAQKEMILESLGGIPKKNDCSSQLERIDRELFHLRKMLEYGHGQAIDYYSPELRPKWDPSAKSSAG